MMAEDSLTMKNIALANEEQNSPAIIQEYGAGREISQNILQG
jgi:hypothetical protein